SDEVIKAALESALKEEQPPPLNQVAKPLGYATDQSIRVRFPDLCKALTEKRQNLLNSRRNRIEGELRQALDSDPPISLNTVSENLGYKTTATLRILYPEECREIRHRYKDYT